MITQLSILIPVYNETCTPLVRQLVEQASLIAGLQYEIVIAEDGSSDQQAILQNGQLAASYPSVRYLRNERNVGRASIRNFLACQARYDWLLFIDCDVVLEKQDFLQAYLTNSLQADVVYGGISIGTLNPVSAKNNLRYCYEKAHEARQTATKRNRHPYRSFRTTNFIVRKAVMLAIPFDKRFTTYGYEDVVFGKALCEHKIKIGHLDNQVTYLHYEDNPAFLEKTEEALRTLYTHQQQLEGYSPLLKWTLWAKRLRLLGLMQAVFAWKKESWRAQLCTSSPSLPLYTCYKLLYFLSIGK